MSKHQTYMQFATPFTNRPILVDPHEVIALAEEERESGVGYDAIVITLVFLRGGAMLGVVGGAEQTRVSLENHKYAHSQGDAHGQ